MSEPSIYEQRILSGRMFRLLFIHPAQYPDQQLRCSCLPFAIDAALPFEALSYVWGSSEPAVQLLCNGQPFTVRPGLANALMRLRLRHSTRIVWADAICINQADVEERNHQVPLMCSIYPAAKRVIVWLGSADPEHTQKALEVVDYIGTSCQQYDRKRGLEFGHDERWDGLYFPTDLFSSAACASLKELFQRPWFSRIWCIQEVRLARDALVLCGEYQVAWTKLGLAASWILDNTGESVVKDPVARMLSKIDVARADIMYNKIDSGLLWTLHSGCEFESTDPKDKVYGLLSLVDPRSEAEALNIDYTKGVGGVYADTVVADILLHSLLSAFVFVTHPPGYDGNSEFRSWAPRWDTPSFAIMLGYPETDCPWNACGDAVVTLTNASHQVSEQLFLKGILFDTVLEVCEVMDHNLDEDYYYNINQDGEQNAEHVNGSTMEDVQMIAEASNRGLHAPSATVISTERSFRTDVHHPLLEIYNKVCRDPCPQSRKNLLARTMTAGTFGDQVYLEKLDAAAKDRYYQAFVHVIQRLAHLDRYGDEGEFAHNNDSSVYEEAAIYSCRQRRMFCTRTGSLGLGPQSMEVNDIVVVLYGGNTPYILRPRGDQYLFMGQAYVDDIMYGEVMDSLRAGKLQEQTFCLI